MKQKIIFIGNPIAGGNAVGKIEKAVRIIKNRGFEVQLRLTSKRGDAESVAREISQQSNTVKHSELLVIAAGGDGTYNEVVNGLANTDIPMAILPLGTTSVLARELSFPSNLERVLDISLSGRIQTIHLGKITLKTRMTGASRYFLLMAGIGFDGETVFGVNEKLKRYSGKGAYILSGLRTLFKYNPEPIMIRSKESSFSGYTAIISKVSCYGGKFKIAPDARLTEPYLYIFMTHKRGKFYLMRCIFNIIKGGHLNLRDISYFKASEIEIEGNAHIQIDGDYLGMTPAKIEVITDALRLVC